MVRAPSSSIEAIEVSRAPSKFHQSFARVHGPLYGRSFKQESSQMLHAPRNLRWLVQERGELCKGSINWVERSERLVGLVRGFRFWFQGQDCKVHLGPAAKQRTSKRTPGGTTEEHPPPLTVGVAPRTTTNRLTDAS